MEMGTPTRRMRKRYALHWGSDAKMRTAPPMSMVIVRRLCVEWTKHFAQSTTIALSFSLIALSVSVIAAKGGYDGYEAV